MPYINNSKLEPTILKTVMGDNEELLDLYLKNIKTASDLEIEQFVLADKQALAILQKKDAMALKNVTFVEIDDFIEQTIKADKNLSNGQDIANLIKFAQQNKQYAFLNDALSGFMTSYNKEISN